MTQANEKGLTAAQDEVLASVATGLHSTPQEVVNMLEAIERGESRAEYFGFTIEVLRGVESIALAYYRGQRFRDAYVVFQMIATLKDGAWPAAWRGMGACAQAQGNFAEAIASFRRALKEDKDDAHSAVYLGECLCLSGEVAQGVAVLQEVLRRHGNSPQGKDTTHLMRARAIVQAGGAIAAQGAAKKSEPTHKAPQKRSAAQAAAAAAHDPLINNAANDVVAAIIDGLTAQPKVQDPEIQALLDDPKTRAQLDEIALAVRRGALTLRELADFTPDQMDAGYAVASQMLERGEPQKALQLAGWMLYIDARDTRFYRLAGLCMHHQKVYAMADYFYTLVDIWRPGGADAATLVYQGEAKLMLDDVASGIGKLQRGITLGSEDVALKEVIKRGKTLLKQMSQRQI